MGRRLSRFLQLERERESREDEQDGVLDRSRFDMLEPKGAPASAPRSADGHLARFGEPEPGELHLDDRRGADQPFARCVQCQTDNGKFVRRCSGCGADLDSAEQRAHNERVWAERREQLAAEAERHRQARDAGLEEALAAARERRAGYEAMARDVARDTRGQFDDAPSVLSLFAWGLLRGRRRRRLPFAMNFGLSLVIGAVFLVVTLVTGTTKSLKAGLTMVLVLVAVSAVRWFFRR